MVRDAEQGRMLDVGAAQRREAKVRAGTQKRNERHNRSRYQRHLRILRKAKNIMRLSFYCQGDRHY